jgi:hypothetical protein
VST